MFNIHAIFVNKTKFFLKFCVITVPVLTKLSRLDQAGREGAVEQRASALLCCPKLQSFTRGGGYNLGM